MKALTLWQPWASLIAWGEKQYETRGYGIAHRGTLAIHAGLMSDSVELVKLNSVYREAFERAGIKVDLGLDIPRGCVLCVVDLTAVEFTDGLEISQEEEAFGDYSHGRYAWKLENLRVLINPIPARGYQGLWEWPIAIETLEFVK
jgi:hypothetical protein